MYQPMELYRAFGRCWISGPTVPRRWHVYFLCHFVLAVAFGVFSFCDTRGIYLGHLEGPYFAAVNVFFLVAVAGGVVLFFVAPLLSLRLLVLARRGGPSFVALAVADCAVTCMHYLAMFVACM